MSRAFTKEDHEAPKPRRNWSLPAREDPSYDEAAASALLEGARVSEVLEAEEATGYRGVSAAPPVRGTPPRTSARGGRRPPGASGGTLSQEPRIVERKARVVSPRRRAAPRDYNADGAASSGAGNSARWARTCILCASSNAISVRCAVSSQLNVSARRIPLALQRVAQRRVLQHARDRRGEFGVDRRA